MMRLEMSLDIVQSVEPEQTFLARPNRFFCTTFFIVGMMVFMRIILVGNISHGLCRRFRLTVWSTFSRHFRPCFPIVRVLIKLEKRAGKFAEGAGLGVVVPDFRRLRM